MGRRRKLTKAVLKAMGATPGLMARRYTQDGRARLEQLAPEGPDPSPLPPPLF